MILFQLPVNLDFEKIKPVEFARVVSNLLVFRIRIKEALFIFKSNVQSQVYPGLRPRSKVCSEHMNETQCK